MRQFAAGKCYLVCACCFLVDCCRTVTPTLGGKALGRSVQRTGGAAARFARPSTSLLGAPLGKRPISRGQGADERMALGTVSASD
jgi:hypothetical protein